MVFNSLGADTHTHTHTHTRTHAHTHTRTYAHKHTHTHTHTHTKVFTKTISRNQARAWFNNGICRPPACQSFFDQDGKQEINLEWPYQFSLFYGCVTCPVDITGCRLRNWTDIRIPINLSCSIHATGHLIDAVNCLTGMVQDAGTKDMQTMAPSKHDGSE